MCYLISSWFYDIDAVAVLFGLHGARVGVGVGDAGRVGADVGVRGRGGGRVQHGGGHHGGGGARLLLVLVRVAVVTTVECGSYRTESTV